MLRPIQTTFNFKDATVMNRYGNRSTKRTVSIDKHCGQMCLSNKAAGRYVDGDTVKILVDSENNLLGIKKVKYGLTVVKKTYVTKVTKQLGVKCVICSANTARTVLRELQLPAGRCYVFAYNGITSDGIEMYQLIEDTEVQDETL